MPAWLKLSNPLLNVCWLRFNNIFSAATNFGCIDSFLRPIPETKKMMGVVSFGATGLPVCFEQ